MTMTKHRIGAEIVIKAYDGPVPDGKAFYAWNTREDGTGAVYKPGKKITMIESLHLYPMWVDAAEEIPEAIE